MYPSHTHTLVQLKGFFHARFLHGLTLMTFVLVQLTNLVDNQTFSAYTIDCFSRRYLGNLVIGI